MQLRIWTAIGIAALGWGTSGVATRVALSAGMQPITLVTLRAIMAAVITYAIFRLQSGVMSRDWNSWRTGAFMAVANLVAPFILLTIALDHASAGFVGLLVALVPPATAVLAHFFLHGEQMHVGRAIGLAVAFGGVAFLLLSGDSGLGDGGRPLLAALLTLGGVLAISFSGIYAKRHHDYNPVELSAMQFTIGGALLVPLALIVDGIPSGIAPWTWFNIGYLVVAGTVMPFLLYYWVLQNTTSTQASLTAYVVPLIALLSGIVLLGEQLQLGIAVGGAMILVGVVVTDRADQRRLVITTRT